MTSKILVYSCMSLVAYLSIFLMLANPINAENYVFNMTKELDEENRLLQFCIIDHKIKLDAIEEFCSTRYGGINTNYGEKIK